MFNFPARRSYRQHPLQVATILALILAPICTAQTHETTFGIVRSVRTPEAFRYLKQFPARGENTPRFILWSDTTHDLYFGHVDSSFTHLVTVHHAVRQPFDDLFIADVAHRSKSDLILLSKATQSVSVYLNLNGDTLNPVSTVALPFVPTGWQIGDINNDGNIDIVVYDRNNPGIVPLYGNGRGKFSIGKMIAPDTPVGRLAITNLNNDNLTDIVVYDWVKSELHLLYGVGRGRFLDQSTFPVTGNVVDIIPALVDPESVLDLVLVTDGPAEVQDWQGNGIGDFRLAKRGALEQGAIAYALGDVNDDQWTDFGFLDGTSTMQLVINNGSDWAQDRVQFYAGEDPTAILFKDFDNDGKTEALVLDRRGKSLRFFFNGAQENLLRDSLAFASAGQPAGLDIHKSGFGPGNDLAVANAQGRSLSMFIQRAHGGLLGQTLFGLSVAPQLLTFHSMTDSSSRYVVTSAAGDSLVFLSLNFKDSSSSYAVIPNEGFAELVQVGVNREGQAEFFTFNTFSGDPNPAIHYFERLNPGTFIEQSFRLNKPDVLLGATAATLGTGPFPDLVYVYRNADSGNVDLVVSYGDSMMTYGQRHSTIELPRTNSDKAYLWTAALTGNDTTDLLLYFSDPANTLLMVEGKGNGRFDTTTTILHHVRLSNRSMLQIIDADNDGIPDIVLNNGARRAIGWLRGNGDGTFQSWRPLVGADPQEFFAVGDLNGDGMPDLAVSLKKNGVVKIYNGALMFAKETHAADQ